jgi:multidrug efflux pump subunit AcrB
MDMTTRQNLFPDAGKQIVVEGKTYTLAYTLATYTLSAWMETDDCTDAQLMLEKKIEDALGTIEGVFHVDYYGVSTPAGRT